MWPVALEICPDVLKFCPGFRFERPARRKLRTGTAPLRFTRPSTPPSQPSPFRRRLLQGEDDEAALQQSQGTLRRTQALLFGIFYVYQKERIASSKVAVAARLLLEYAQLVLLVLQPSFGFRINAGFWLWQVLNWVAHFSTGVVAKGYSLYIGVLIALSVLVFVALLLAAWVGWCFRHENSGKLLRFKL